MEPTVMSLSLKRSGSEIDLYEEKPAITSASPSESGSEGYIPLSKIKSTKSTQNKKARSNSRSDRKGNDGQDDLDHDKGIKRKWTDEEDKIFLQLMSNLVKTKMWDTIKEDGRLGYRGCPGIRAHAIAMLNKLKKA